MIVDSSRNPRPTPTIKDVADEAKVSRATVSRAFGQPHLLSRETVERVHAIAKRLGYVPNHMAQALSTGRAGNIALVVPDIINPFFAAIMRSAQTKALAQGYATFLGDADETPDIEDVLLTKLSAQVEGFILASSRLPKECILKHARRRPLVLINCDVAPLPRLLIDAAASYGRAVEHLVSLGHRSIAYVAGPTRSWSDHQRHKAVAKAAQQFGIRTVRIETSRPSFEGGQGCTPALIDAKVTAALAFDDVTAQGIMAGLAGCDLSVPADFSLVGCDDVGATTIYPPMTSIRINCADVGEQAVNLLVNVLAGKEPRVKRLYVPTELIIRATTAPPPGRPRRGAASSSSRQPSPPPSAPEPAKA